MTLVASKHADEIREMWQSRALRAADGKMRRVLVAALTKEYPAAIVTLLKVTFPGFIEFEPPIFIGYASIQPDGKVACEAGEVRLGVTYRGLLPVFDSEQQFIYEMRKLADRLKLSDRDRTEMFTVLQKWVASDRRIGAQGERLAS